MLRPGNFWLRVLARPAVAASRTEAASRLNAAWPALADSVISPTWSATHRKAMVDSVFVFEPGATGWTYLREIYERPLLVLMPCSGTTWPRATWASEPTRAYRFTPTASNRLDRSAPST